MCRFGIDHHKVVLDSVDCESSSYLNLLQCSHDSTPICGGNDRDLFVECCEFELWYFFP